MRALINGTELYYEAHGAGPPILFMHGGLGLDHTYFRPWLDPLADAARLIYYDHRGNGRSARPEDWSVVDHQVWVDDAEALRAHLGHDRVILFGHSYGGFLAQEYALRYPDRVAGLILCSTAPALDYPDVALANARARGTHAQIDALGRVLSERAPDDETAGSWWRDILPLYFHRPDPALLRNVADRIQYSSGAWNRSIFELTATFDVTNRLSEIRHPTLVLSGRADWIMPPEKSAGRIHAALPDSEMVVFEGSGHFPWMEEPDAFVDAVRNWLRRGPA